MASHEPTICGAVITATGGFRCSGALITTLRSSEGRLNPSSATIASALKASSRSEIRKYYHFQDVYNKVVINVYRVYNSKLRGIYMGYNPDQTHALSVD